MSDRAFSVILLPTAECNVACEYCFEYKEPLRLSLEALPALTESVLAHMEQEGFGECEVYWQGGEALIMGPDWYRKAKVIMEEAAARRGLKFVHYLQTNLIGYSKAWNDIIFDMFDGSLGTSMDYPNLHRKLFSGSAGKYTEVWRERLEEVRSSGIHVGVIAVLHQGSLDAGAEAFYRYFVEELGITDFQVNTPFPGGPANEAETEFQLESGALAEFLGDLFEIWMENGYKNGVQVGPFDALINHFSGRPARLPCIWKENCSNQFVSIDAKGTVAQCDCWVTSYPDYYFGNIFREPDLSRMLSESPARQKFVERPGKLVEDEDCLSCRFLSICHGGCPVRTYAAMGTLDSKDPYCEVYKRVFSQAERYGNELRKKAVLAV
ncbi:MAG: radical SAM protein [Verrucomicrobiales bacterium]|nr:radical SAM protein [Verrucomicrobiales bacterium]